MLYVFYNNNISNKLSGVLTFVKGLLLICEEMNINYVEVSSLSKAVNLMNSGDSLFFCTSIIGDCKKSKELFHIMQSKNIKIFVYNTEDICNSEKWHNYLIDFLNQQAYYVMDFSKQRLDMLSNPNKLQVTPGYHRYLEEFKNELTKDTPTPEKKFDVLLYGGLNSRRLYIKEQLLSSGLRVKFKNNYVNHNMQLKDTLGSKIVLDTYYYGVTGIDFFRCSFLASNKIFFIHETPAEEDTDDEFLNTVVHCKYEDIAQECIKWLSKSQEERDTKALEVYNLFKRKYNLKEQLKNSSLIQDLSE
jgi:hypothetical protein